MGSHSSSETTLPQPSVSFVFHVETPIGNPHHQLYKVYKQINGKQQPTSPCTFADMINELSLATTDTLLSQSNSFIYQFVESIKRFPYANAVFFETPATTLDTYVNMPFEYILIPSPVLEQVQMDTSTFEKKFEVVCSETASSSSFTHGKQQQQSKSSSVVSFTNLSGTYSLLLLLLLVYIHTYIFVLARFLS